MRVEDEIHRRLADAFAPRKLEVVDESESHRGHSGYREGGQSHFRVWIASEGVQGAKPDCAAPCRSRCLGT